MREKQNIYDYSFEMKQKRTKNTKLFLTVLLGVFLFLTLLLNFVFFPVLVKSDSMETNVSNDGVVFVSPLLKTPKRGDVYFISRMDGYKNTFGKNVVDSVVRFFTLQKRSPFSRSHNMSGNPFVRRVLGVPGDTLYMKDFVVYIKPKGQDLFLTEFELCGKSYNVQIFSIPTEWNNVGVSGETETYVLKEGEYFVLADNRVESLDSRHWGIIDSDRFLGRVLLQCFPFNKIRLF